MGIDCDTVIPKRYRLNHRETGVNMKKFIVGNTYSTRSACDYNCVFSFKVVARTDKSITIVGDLLDKPARKKIRVYGEEESVMPYGSYSMAPVITA
jgi:hypothetical protein